MKSREQSLEKVAALVKAEEAELIVLAEKHKTQISLMRELRKHYSLTAFEANELRKALVVLLNMLEREEV